MPRPHSDAGGPEAINRLQTQYGVELRGGRRNAPIIGQERNLLTAGQVRGFQAQQEIRAARAARAAAAGPAHENPFGALRRTNNALHEYVAGINGGNARETMRRTGAAMQGHGLVHTVRNRGEVLLGSRGSHNYRDVANNANSQTRTANIIQWNIHRNDAFMAGALLGHNDFTLPRQSHLQDFIQNGARPGRVTTRELSQMGRFADLPNQNPALNDLRATVWGQPNRFHVGSSQGHQAMPGNFHVDMAGTGNLAQNDLQTARNVVARTPGVLAANLGGGRGGRGGRRGGGRRGRR